MANTPEGTPYVESSDLVANYPAASLALANRVDLVGVLPFADAAARTTAISSPTDGQYSYLQDTNATEFWNGSAWVAAGVAPGLVLINTTTFSAVSSISVNNCFTTAHEDYLIIMSVTNASMSSPNGLIRFRASGADNTTTRYNSRLYSGSVYGTSDVNQGFVWLTQNGGYSDLVMSVNKPQAVWYTQTHYSSDASLNAVAQQNRGGTMAFLNTTQFDGFTIFPGDGNITGKLRVYGYGV